MKSGKKMWLVAGILVVLVIAAAAGAIWMVNRSANSESIYLEAISTAEKYVADEDYDNAILAYQEAIQKDSQNETGYTGLANVYITTKNYSQAAAILSVGIERTGSSTLRTMLTKVTQLQEEETETDASELTEQMADTEEKESTGLSILVDTFRSYTQEEYVTLYGEGSFEDLGDGTARVRYVSLAADVYYRNTSDSTTFNSVKKEVFAASKPYRICFDTLEGWLSGLDYPVSQDELAETVGAIVVLGDNTEHGTRQLEFTYRFCTCRIGCDDSGNITDASAWSEIVIGGEGEEEDETAVFEGQVVDAQTGLGVANAALTFTDSDGKEYEASTDSQGYYEIEIETGEYTVQVQADGYQTEEFDKEIEDLTDYDQGTFTITQELGENEIRIVLEWEASPRDLDSWVVCDSFSVGFSNMSASSESLTANLDTDDRNGYGPETITVQTLSSDASFVYYVRNFSGESSIAGCGATVKVYVNGESPITFTVPASGGSDIWEVFEYKDGTISEIGTLSG